MNKNIFAHAKRDLPAGIVVFLVAVPLCLGIALASGAPFFSGMIAGIVGGIVIGFISNSPLSVSGPAAGLTAVVLASITKLGAFETFLLAVVFAGVIQIILSLIKAGTIANYFPSNVIKGMLTAIGIIIILKQIPHAFGYDKDSEGDFAFLQPDGENTFSALLKPFAHIDLGATLICLIAITLLILWEKPFIKKHVKLIPGGLVAVVTAVLLSEFVFSNISMLTIAQEHKVNVPVAKNLDDFLGFFTLPDFSQVTNPEVYIIALTLAAVASIESLLCIEAVDKLDTEKRITNTNRELAAQGIGNILSGLIGGLPVTSVIVRSSANVNAQAKTKLSTIFHGILLLVCVAFIPVVLNKIPLSALAAILLVTGYKLCNPKVFTQMIKNGKYQWVPFVITVVAIVFTDLLTGVGIGLVVSVSAILIGNFKNSYFFHKENHHEGDAILIHLSEEVSFLNKASIRQTLDELPENSTVIIDAFDCQYIDFDVLEIIREFKDEKAPVKNINCKTVGFKEEYKIANTDNVKSVKELIPRYHSVLVEDSKK
ncbi:MAG: SulP family inorganic anion transporter [Ferruginibacter sp.]